MTPETLGDAELSVAVAEKVAGWIPPKHELAIATHPDGRHGFTCDGTYPPPYATSADAVMPLLEKEDKWMASSFTATNGSDTGKRFRWVKVGHNHYGEAETFARAACLALLRAHDK